MVFGHDVAHHQKYPSRFFFSIEPASSRSIRRPWRSEVRGGQHLADDALERVGVGFDRAGQRIAAERAEADHAVLDRLARLQLHALVVAHDQHAVALDHRPLLGEVERHDRDVLLQDVLPDVELGPVRQREDADRFALARRGCCRSSTFPAAGSSGPRHAARCGTRRCAPWRATSPRRGARRRRPRRSRICRAPGAAPTVFMTWVWVFEPWSNGLMPSRTPSSLMWTIRSKPSFCGHLVAKLDHLAELPGRVDMQEGKRRLGRIEGLHRQMQQDRRILADRIEHHRLGEGRRHFAKDVDRLGFEAVEMGQLGKHGNLRKC